jgi:hypothetical protein
MNVEKIKVWFTQYAYCVAFKWFYINAQYYLHVHRPLPIFWASNDNKC